MMTQSTLHKKTSENKKKEDDDDDTITVNDLGNRSDNDTESEDDVPIGLWLKRRKQGSNGSPSKKTKTVVARKEPKVRGKKLDITWKQEEGS